MYQISIFHFVYLFFAKYLLKFQEERKCSVHWDIFTESVELRGEERAGKTKGYKVTN